MAKRGRKMITLLKLILYGILATIALSLVLMVIFSIMEAVATAKHKKGQ